MFDQLHRLIERLHGYSWWQVAVELLQARGGDSPGAGLSLQERGTVLHRTLAAFWEDVRAREVAFAALLLCLGLWAYVLARFPSLPATLDLTFPPGARGELIAVSSREALLTLPQMATGLLLVNLVIGVFVHAQSRVGAYVLFATGALAPSDIAASSMRGSSVCIRVETVRTTSGSVSRTCAMSTVTIERGVSNREKRINRAMPQMRPGRRSGMGMTLVATVRQPEF